MAATIVGPDCDDDEVKHIHGKSASNARHMSENVLHIATSLHHL